MVARTVEEQVVIRKIYLNPKFILACLLLTALLSLGLFFFQEKGVTPVAKLILYTLGILSLNLFTSLFFTLEVIFLKFKGDKLRYGGSFFFI